MLLYSFAEKMKLSYKQMKSDLQNISNNLNKKEKKEEAQKRKLQWENVHKKQVTKKFNKNLFYLK